MTSCELLFSSKHLGYLQPRQYSLVLCLEFKLNSILQNIPLHGCDDDTCFASLLRGRPVHMYRPVFFLVIFVFRGCEFCYEIRQRLGFYGHSGSIFYIKLTKLDGPLYHLSSGLKFIHCFLNWLVCHYYDRVSLKVWTKLSGGHY